MIQKIRKYIPRDYELFISKVIVFFISYFILTLLSIEFTIISVVAVVLIVKFKLYLPVAKKLYENHPKTILQKHTEEAELDKLEREKEAQEEEKKIKFKKDEEFKISAQKHKEELAKKRKAKAHREILKDIKLLKERQKLEKKQKADTKKIDKKINLLLNTMTGNNQNNYLKLKKDYISYIKKHGGGTDENKLNWIKEIEQKIEDEVKAVEEALNNSPLYNYFNAIDGGETTFYYLKLSNKFHETRYKVGVTLSSVAQRYNSNYEYKILYENKLTHANSIEKAILKKFNHLVTDESLLGTNGTEIFKEDILKLDTKP